MTCDDGELERNGESDATTTKSDSMATSGRCGTGVDAGHQRHHAAISPELGLQRSMRGAHGFDQVLHYKSQRRSSGTSKTTMADRRLRHRLHAANTTDERERATSHVDIVPTADGSTAPSWPRQTDMTTLRMEEGRTLTRSEDIANEAR